MPAVDSPLAPAEYGVCPGSDGWLKAARLGRMAARVNE
jgi:hypothetical protein